jgi:hypothetical protein
VDADMARRIRAEHVPTVTWWGCAVQLRCLACRAAYPCPLVVRLEVELVRAGAVRGNAGRFGS